MAERLDAVLRVIQLAEEAGVRGGQVIALQVIVYVHLPVAMNVVGATVELVEPSDA